MPREPDVIRDRLSLIVITDAAAAAPRSIIDVVARAVAAGAPAIQLRDKGASARELHEVGLRLREVTRAADALLFVNDRYDVALAIGADGVHVGPDDVPVHALRSVVSPDFLIGASTDDPSRAARLERDGASYIGCGAVHPTQSKDDAGGGHRARWTHPGRGGGLRSQSWRSAASTPIEHAWFGSSPEQPGSP